MARDYDDMEDDNPIEEDFQDNSNECLFCGEPCRKQGDSYCSWECEAMDEDKFEEEIEEEIND